MKHDLHRFYSRYWTPETWRTYSQSASPAICYHNAREVGFIREIIQPAGGELILDAGCGYGRLSEVLLDANPAVKVVGADISPSMIAYASEWLNGRFKGIVTDLETLPFPDNTFDAAVCFGVIMYVRDEAAAVCELARVLRPQGRLLLSAHNLLSPFSLPIVFNNRVVKRGCLKQSRRTLRHYSKLLSGNGIKVNRVMTDAVFTADMTPPRLRNSGRVYLPPRWSMPALRLLDGLAAKTFLTSFGHELYFYGVKET